MSSGNARLSDTSQLLVASDGGGSECECDGVGDVVVMRRGGGVK